MTKNSIRWNVCAAFGASLMLQTLLQAQTPIANTVPFLSSQPTVPHTSWSGNAVTLKGTLTSSAFGTHTFTYDWNPGDGSKHCTGTVTNQYDIECAVTYTGAVGSLYIAVLTITDTTNSQVSPVSNCPPGSFTAGACYYTSLYAPPPNLPIEVNNAIDRGLWYLHTNMARFVTTGGAQAGNWPTGNVAWTGAGDTGVNALECSAFQNSGFLQTDNPANPYTDDVRLCINGIFDQLTTIPIAKVVNGTFGNFNPDSNANGIGVEHNGGDTNYETGMMLDAIVGTQTPNSVITPGTALATKIAGLKINGSGPSGAYTYKDAVFDMVDSYVYCQAPNTGGWHYTCQETTGDNSVSQWAATGIIPALRTIGFAATVDPELHKADASWLDESFTQAGKNNGYFGYTSNSPVWGPYADTPSGMVQLALNGLGRGTTSPSGKNLWDSAETYLRDNFGNAQSAGAANSLKDYYYGMFSFTKAMIFHDNSGTGLGSSPITFLQSLDDPNTCLSPGVPVHSPGTGSSPCYPSIDWYAAQTTAYGGTDATNGVARTILGNQLADGSWFGQNYNDAQNYFQTGIAITMLNQTIVIAKPVACFTPTPSRVASGGTVLLDGRCSVDQASGFQLVSWQWDVSGTGGQNFTIGPGSPQCLDASCSEISYPFKLPAGQKPPYNYPVTLLVTDNQTSAKTGTVVGNVVIAAPPNPPTANAGGPYNFCPNTTAAGAVIYMPFLLDGSKSINPDQGTTDGTPGAPPSTITAFDWDYACAGTYNSAHGSQVDATAAFDVPADFGTNFNICLRVTNNDNLAFPTAGLTAGLTSLTSAQVSIHKPTDEVCTHCVQSLGGRAKAPTPGTTGSIQLYWIDTNTSTAFTIDHYNVYRSTSPSFNPFSQIAGANSSPFVPAVAAVRAPGGGTLFFLDANVVGGTTYYYRVAPATANDTETCQGNVTIAVALSTGR